MKAVRSVVAGIGLVALLAIVALSCGQEAGEPIEVATSDFTLPIGDAAAGRQAFIDMECYACHAVAGDAEMPAPTETVHGPEIGAAQASQTREYIADSIISPAHIIPPPETESPMPKLRTEMSVQQLVDLVAFCGSGQ